MFWEGLNLQSTDSMKLDVTANIIFVKIYILKDLKG